MKERQTGARAPVRQLAETGKTIYRQPKDLKRAARPTSEQLSQRRPQRLGNTTLIFCLLYLAGSSAGSAPVCTTPPRGEDPLHLMISYTTIGVDVETLNVESAVIGCFVPIQENVQGVYCLFAGCARTGANQYQSAPLHYHSRRAAACSATGLHQIPAHSIAPLRS